MPCAQRAIGEMPDWWENDIESAVGLNPFDHEHDVGNLTIYMPWLAWAKENGIAPGQPFRLYVPEPSYDGWGEDATEDWEYKIERIVPWPARVFTECWMNFYRKLHARTELAARAYDEATLRVHRNTGAMYLYQSAYQPSCDAYGFPRGVLLRLCTRISEYIPYLDRETSGGWYLAEARDDRGDRDKALQQLIDDACARLPALSPSIIKEMEVKF